MPRMLVFQPEGANQKTTSQTNPKENNTTNTMGLSLASRILNEDLFVSYLWDNSSSKGNKVISDDTSETQESDTHDTSCQPKDHSSTNKDTSRYHKILGANNSVSSINSCEPSKNEPFPCKSKSSNNNDTLENLNNNDTNQKKTSTINNCFVKPRRSLSTCRFTSRLSDEPDDQLPMKAQIPPSQQQPEPHEERSPRADEDIDGSNFASALQPLIRKQLLTETCSLAKSSQRQYPPTSSTMSDEVRELRKVLSEYKFPMRRCSEEYDTEEMINESSDCEQYYRKSYCHVSDEELPELPPSRKPSRRSSSCSRYSSISSPCSRKGSIRYSQEWEEDYGSKHNSLCRDPTFVYAT